MRLILVCLTTSALLAVGLGVQGDAAAPPPCGQRAGDDAYDLIFLQGVRPYRLRLHLQVKGRSFQADWNDTMGHLFRYLDTRGKGVLSKAEADRAPSVRQWHQMRQGAPAIEPDAGADVADLADAQGRVTRQSLSSYYARSGAGVLQVESGYRGRAGDGLSDLLFKHLDRNGDGRLTREELVDAPRVLDRFDRDGDEMVTPAELGPVYDQAPVYVSGPAHGLATGGLPFFYFLPGGPVDPLVQRLLERYDRNRDRKLSRAEVAFPPALSARLDKDGDGQLDPGELARWVELPADLEVILPLENPGRQAVVLPGTAGDVRVSRLPGGSVLVDVGEARIEVARRPGGRGNRGQKPLQQAAQNAFRAADANGDGVLVEKEIYQPPFALVALLRLADRDGDGKVTLKEYEAFTDLQGKIVSTNTFLRLSDRGRNLFGLMDADQDGRLSPRELGQVWTRLSSWNSTFRRDDLPHLYRLTISQGTPVADEAGGARLTGVHWAGRGPVWFRKMDRNGDGDLSRGEWLGTEAQFRKVDADGDGLIDVDEATKADTWFRGRNGK